MREGNRGYIVNGIYKRIEWTKKGEGDGRSGCG